MTYLTDEIEYWMNEYPDLDREEVIELLEAIELDDKERREYLDDLFD